MFAATFVCIRVQYNYMAILNVCACTEYYQVVYTVGKISLKVIRRQHTARSDKGFQGDKEIARTVYTVYS